MSGLLAAAIGGFAGGVSDAWKDNRETAMQKAKEQMQMRLQDRADQRALNSEKMRFKNNMAVEQLKIDNKPKDVALFQDADGNVRYREKRIGGLLDGDTPISNTAEGQKVPAAIINSLTSEINKIAELGIPKKGDDNYDKYISLSRRLDALRGVSTLSNKPSNEGRSGTDAKGHFTVINGKRVYDK